MAMAKLVRILLLERKMTLKELAEKMGTSPQNLGSKLSRDNLNEETICKIAEACDATFTGIFTLNDTGKEIK